MGGGGSSNTKGKIKLPIFKLPSIDTSRLKSREQDRHLEKALQQGETFEQRFIPYRDVRSYRKAVMLMIKSFGKRDVEYIKAYLGMTAADIDDLEGELRKKTDLKTPRTPSRTPRTPKTPKTPKLNHSSSASSIASSSSRNIMRGASNEKDLTVVATSGDSLGGDPNILDTLFHEDPNISVFALAKDVVVQDKKDQTHESLGDQKEALMYNKALRNITSKMDISALGLSDDMAEFLFLGGHTSSSSVAERGTESFEKLKTNMGTALGGFSSALTQSHTRAAEQQAQAQAEMSSTVHKVSSMPSLYSMHPRNADGTVGGGNNSLSSTYGRKIRIKGSKTTNKVPKTIRLQPIMLSQTDGFLAPQASLFSKSSNGVPHHHSSSAHKLPSGGGGAGFGIAANSAGSSSKDLTLALMSSLRTMQKHSNMIKESISTAQNVINIADPKAKGLIFQVAAEAMRRAMEPFLLFEIKRGFTAWSFVVRQERRQEKAGVFIHFLTVRNTLLALNAILTRVLHVNMQRWKAFTVAELQRIKKEKMLKAVLKIQGLFRTRIAKRKVEVLRQRRKYQKLYDSTIKIQALFRGKLGRWRFLRETRDKLRNNGATQMQRIVRGYIARKRVHILRLRKNKALAATTIQKIVRGRAATKRVQVMLTNRRHGQAVTKMQSFIRGWLGRKHIARILLELAHYKYIVRIQAMVRGALGRMHLVKKIAEMQEYRAFRYKAATLIQSAYRGYRCSVLYKMMMYKVNKTRKEEARAATAINRIVRGFISRAYLRDLRKAQREQWIRDARHFKETWADDSESWFYYNEETGEALWEPSAMGYTKSDGLLVLASGEIIEDPAKAAHTRRNGPLDGDYDDYDEEEAVKEAPVDKKKASRLCSECNDRTAIRACTECGDKFCTKCYKYLHATGSRRNHTYTAIGPLDCTECELRLAERWCVSCDESFCDPCWRKVHGRGKRVFHPYSEISTEGRIDPRIFTMDGDQVSCIVCDATHLQKLDDIIFVLPCCLFSQITLFFRACSPPHS